MAQAQLTHEADPHPPKGVDLIAFSEAADQHPIEVVNGEIVIMSPSQRRHSQVTRTLFLALYQFVADHKLGEVWMETAYVLEGEKSRDWVYHARVPDVSFISRERVDAYIAEQGADDGPWWLVPDLTVEIISPTDRYKDVEAKIAEHLRFGVRLVWLISPETKSVRIFTPDNPGGDL